VPEALRFRAGGDDSVRGYAYRSLGPVTAGTIGSGNSLLTASLEVARPITAAMPTLWGAVFVDAGQAADTFAALRPAVGTGVGVRWRSPVGPLKIDIARGLEVQQWRLHFSMGIVF
jgi:translocation and assembly module TamA